MSYSVDLQYEVPRSGLPDAQAFQLWTHTTLQGRRLRAEVCIRLVSAAESQELNRTWRGKDYPTNVLSFPFEAPPGIPIDSIGDLVICAEVVKQEALEQGKQELDHWAHLVIHGLLHLIGFDHINDAEAEEMEALEISLLARLGIPNPYESA
ncbi:rRNA maturation RNase YbeY [Nitrincola tapanii]|uniref:Endoribonuclease YbeY n=1 Tax=Nitrincola tapanii TaxID=1708751 RepID=A0A5A9W253_9GAMM|nr:rRNA maturation RNase YbeY [Nitrincola tapanii]KAA0874633.1 rRNA maturation RNase YbeY [Nitrincola tapanii]